MNYTQSYSVWLLLICHWPRFNIYFIHIYFKIARKIIEWTLSKMQCLAQLVQHVQIICNTSIAKVYSVLIVLCSDLAVFFMFQYFKLFRLLQVGKVSSFTPSPLEKVLCFSYAKLRHTYFLDFHVKILPDKKKEGRG